MAQAPGEVEGRGLPGHRVDCEKWLGCGGAFGRGRGRGGGARDNRTRGEKNDESRHRSREESSTICVCHPAGASEASECRRMLSLTTHSIRWVDPDTRYARAGRQGGPLVPGCRGWGMADHPSASNYSATWKRPGPPSTTTSPICSPPPDAGARRGAARRARRGPAGDQRRRRPRASCCTCWRAIRRAAHPRDRHARRLQHDLARARAAGRRPARHARSPTRSTPRSRARTSRAPGSPAASRSGSGRRSRRCRSSPPRARRRSTSIFIDADKPSNARLLRLGAQALAPGSVIIVDNVVRDGAVADADSDDRERPGHAARSTSCSPPSRA